MMTASGGSTSTLQSRNGRCACCGAALRVIKGDRRFTLLDAMILVAASAVAFVLARPALDSWYVSRLPLWGRVLSIVIAVLVTWTPTTLYLKLRSPRPTLRRLSKQPDFVALLAATSIIVLAAFSVAILALVRVARQGAISRQGRGFAAPSPIENWWLWVVIFFAGFVGAAVLASWVVLIVSGRHRASWGWLDLLGRTIGAAWVTLLVISCVAHLAQFRN